jgi:hypothetical protein
MWVLSVAVGIEEIAIYGGTFDPSITPFDLRAKRLDARRESDSGARR